MMQILAELAWARNQNISECYMTHDCETVSAGYLNATQFPVDRCQANQIVGGHGLTADFATYWNIPSDRLRLITMVREPMARLLSNYKQRVGANVSGYEG